MKFNYNDGGRVAAGYKGGQTGDCVARAIAIATGKPYDVIYKRLADGTYDQRRGKGHKTGRPRSAANGINVKRQWFKRYMQSLGFTWVSTMGIGTGCKVHLREDELSKGHLVVAVSKHYTAVINHVINDTFNPDRNGTRCVYGYWIIFNS